MGITFMFLLCNSFKKMTEGLKQIQFHILGFTARRSKTLTITSRQEEGWTEDVPGCGRWPQVTWEQTGSVEDTCRKHWSEHVRNTTERCSEWPSRRGEAELYNMTPSKRWQEKRKWEQRTHWEDRKQIADGRFKPNHSNIHIKCKWSKHPLQPSNSRKAPDQV